MTGGTIYINSIVYNYCIYGLFRLAIDELKLVVGYTKSRYNSRLLAGYKHILMI
jgi:hypothetical protein